MGLLDEIHAAAPTRKRPCSVATLMATMSKEDAKQLSTALADPSISHMAISNALVARGCDMEYQRLMRHRNGRCGCDLAK